MRVSLVMLLRTSSTITSPISDDDAKDFASSGSATGLSRLTCGKSSLTGWANFSFSNWVAPGEFDALTNVR